MDIRDLDEFQGVTAEQLNAGMESEGWTLIDGQWERVIDGHRVRITTFDELYAYTDNPQEFLRRINPRLRKGVPSMEARREHRLWLCVCGPGSISVLKVDDYPDEGSLYRVGGMGRCVLAACELCEFWPCDAAGNKVRWPERDGVML